MTRVTVSHPRMLAVILLSAVALLTACGGGSTVAENLPVTAPRALRLGTVIAPWSVWRHQQRPLDLAGPLPGGSLVLAAHGRLYALSAAGRRRPFSAAYDRPGNASPTSPSLRPDTAAARSGSAPYMCCGSTAGVGWWP